LRRRIVDNSGSLALEWMGVQFGSLTITSRAVHGRAWELRVEVECSRCRKRHLARFHNIRKRPKTEACPHCNPREPVTVPKWLYSRCQAQMQRCRNPNDDAFARYGARGIEFRFQSANAASVWVLENLGAPSRAMCLDRIDNNKHYEPGNLRWVTPLENSNNTRKTGARSRFASFRKAYPSVRYADATLTRLILRGLTDEEISARWLLPSNKPKGKYGTCSPLGLYRGSLVTDG